MVHTPTYQCGERRELHICGVRWGGVYIPAVVTRLVRTVPCGNDEILIFFRVEDFFSRVCGLDIPQDSYKRLSFFSLCF